LYFGDEDDSIYSEGKVKERERERMTGKRSWCFISHVLWSGHPCNTISRTPLFSVQDTSSSQHEVVLQDSCSQNHSYSEAVKESVAWSSSHQFSLDSDKRLVIQIQWHYSSSTEKSVVLQWLWFIVHSNP
jgi:arylamine N-acetyltransferase